MIMEAEPKQQKNLVSTEFQLIIFITEVENIVNSRPITSVAEDPSDLEALTPNHFLKEFNNNNILANLNKEPIGTTHRKRWKHIQICLEHFWSRRTIEYLLTLTTRNIWVERERNIKIGELIVLQTDARRGQWPLGVITETIPGRDDRIRMAYVRTCNCTYLRPVAKIYSLENPNVC